MIRFSFYDHDATQSECAHRLNSAHAPLNRDDGGCFLTPIYTSSEKRPLISYHIKGPLVAEFRSPLMKAPDRSVETLGL